MDNLSAHKVYYHRVGTDQDKDVLIYTNLDDQDWEYVSIVTNDGKYLLVDRRGECGNNLGIVTFADISCEPNSKLD